MNINLQPESLSLAGNLRHLIVNTDEDVSFAVRIQGAAEDLVQRVYSPNAQNLMEVDLYDIVFPQLTFHLQNISTPYQQADIVKTFVITLKGVTSGETRTVTFTALRAGVDRLADTAQNFLTNNFLTWQPNLKPVTYYSPEFLTYYATVVATVKCEVHFAASSSLPTQSLTLATIPAGQAYTIPVGYAVIAGKVNELPSYYDIWVENGSGQRLTYIQRYYANNMRSEQEQWILFENSLGGIDTFRAYGSLDLDAQHNHNLVEVEEVSQEYRVDTERKYKKNTGRLDKKERLWLLDFFPSLRKYIYLDDYIRQIVVTESDVNYKAQELPSQYTFTYRYADAKPYLNLPRTDQPTGIVDIEVPDVGSFTIAPRLVEFPRLQLSSGALFPVQDPYSQDWNATTLGAVFAYFIEQILAQYDGQGGIGHMHPNLDFLNQLSPDFVRSLTQQFGSEFFLSKLNDDTARGVITFMKGLISEAYTKFGAGADFGQFVQGLVGGDGARIDEHGNMEATSLVLRSFLEVPKLVYNHVDVRVGDEWQTNGAGEIESVEIDQNNPLQGTIKLHLLDGEYGTLKVGDKCKGIYHNLEGYNDSVTHDDGKGGRTFAGFYTSYFVITGVSGTHNQYLTYELRPTVEVNGYFYWLNDQGTSSGIRGGFHPSAHMVFAQYSNAVDNTRQSCQYRTTTYTRMLSYMTGWDEGLANVAFQIGNTPLIASAYNIPDAGRYSLWINGDIYFAGTLNRIDSWGREVEDYPDQGDHSSATQYHLNDLVHYNGTVYRMTIDNDRTKGVLPGTSVVIDGQTVYPWQKWIWAESISPEGHWSSAKTPYKVNSIVNLYTNIYMSKRQTSNAPMQLLMDEEGRYITTEDGGYIIIDDTTNDDWELLLNVGDITNGRDGENALYINLTNDTDSVLTDEKGNITGSLPTTTGQLYSGTTLITQGVVWGISTQSGCTASISASTGVLKVLTMTADEASVVVTATYNERTYGKVFTFKKLYGRDKMWLELGNDVIKYDLETKTFNPSSITLYAYRTSVQNYDKELVTADSVGWIEVGNDHTHKHSRDVVTISMSSFTNGHLIVLLRDSNGDIQDVEDIVLVQDTLQLKPVGHWTSTLKVIRNNIVDFYDGTFVALQDSVGIPPVMSLLTNQNGDYITNESGGYIIINDTVNTTYWRRLTTNGKNGVDGKDGEDGRDGENAVTYTLSVTPTSFVRNANGDYKSTATVKMQVYRNEGGTSTLLDNIMLPKLKVYVDGTLYTPSWVAAEYEWQYTLPKGASVVEARLYNGDNVVARQSISIAQDGSEGLQGCVTRVSEWKANTPYRNDEGRNVTPGFIDVVAREDSSQTEGYRFYQLQRLAGEIWDEYENSTPPENDNHWKAVSNVGPIYTSLLIAKNAFIKFGSTNQFVVVNSDNQIEAGMKGDGSIRFFAGSSGTAVSDGSISNAPYRVYKDGSFYATNAHIEGYVKATEGEFTGTITAQSGEIGGFTIGSNLLYNNNYAASISIKDKASNPTQIVVIGKDASDAYTGSSYKCSMQAEATGTGTYNTALYLNAQNGTYNYAFHGNGNGVLNGFMAGFRPQIITIPSGSGDVSSSRILIREGSLVVIKGSHTSGSVVVGMPTLTEIRRTLGIDSSTPFFFELNVISYSTYEFVRLAFRGDVGQSGSEYPILMGYDDKPLKDGLSARTSWQIAQGDYFKILLTYIKNTSGTLEYRAYVLQNLN